MCSQRSGRCPMGMLCSSLTIILPNASRGRKCILVQNALTSRRLACIKFSMLGQCCHFPFIELERNHAIVMIENWDWLYFTPSICCILLRQFAVFYSVNYWEDGKQLIWNNFCLWRAAARQHKNAAQFSCEKRSCFYQLFWLFPTLDSARTFAEMRV